MPSTIPAAMASAISWPLSVKMRNFLSLSGTLLDRTRRRTCPDTKLALGLYGESQITVKCVTVSADQTKQQAMSASGFPGRVKTPDVGTAQGIKQRSFRLTPGPFGSGPILHVAGRSLLRGSGPAYRRADCP